MEQNTRICVKCRKLKPIIDFKRPNVKSYWCKECVKINKSNWYYYGNGKNWHLKYEYGITLAQYSTLLANQNGRCAICKNLPDKKALAVDHCHTTNKVRGLLCNECNTGVGAFKDNSIILQNAVTYLKGGSNGNS